MKFSTQSTQIEKLQTDCLIVGVYEDDGFTPAAAKCDQLGNNVISHLIKQKSFQGKSGQILPLFHFADGQFPLVLLIGCGKKGSLSATLFKKLVLGAMNAFKAYQFANATCCLAELHVPDCDTAWKVRQIVEATHEAFYRFDIFKTLSDPAFNAQSIIITVESKAVEDDAVQTALMQGNIIGEAVAFTKNLGNTPSNVCTPDFLAEQARDLAKHTKHMTVKVLGEAEMGELGMGALLGVSQGSSQEAKLICLEYKGKVNHSKHGAQGPIAFVGKGITFDTGGNSLKPADSMVGMKYDMCGGATVLGVMKAAAELALPLHLVGIVAAVENMPGGTAYKPEDILTSLSGQTIEVLNTDAEGRLILADAITYSERYQPEVVIDIATLTGAAVIALGTHASAVLSNNEALSTSLLKAGIESNDRAWPLPLWEEYQDQLKSPFADMANVGGRPAGTITAACFLSRFAKKVNWAHLDVAGTAATMFGTTERAATGRPVPLLVQYLLDTVKHHAS